MELITSIKRTLKELELKDKNLSFNLLTSEKERIIVASKLVDTILEMAELLGESERNLYRKLKVYKIKRKDARRINIT